MPTAYSGGLRAPPSAARSARAAPAQEYCDAQHLVWNDAPWISLWTQKFPIVYSSQILDVRSNPTESFDTAHARPA